MKGHFRTHISPARRLEDLWMLPVFPNERLFLRWHRLFFRDAEDNSIKRFSTERSKVGVECPIKKTRI